MRKKTYAVLAAVLAASIGAAYLYTYLKPIQDIAYYQNEVHKTKIRIYLNFGPQDGKSRIYQDIINNYNEEHNDVIIETSYVPGNDYVSRLKIDFVSGNEADIFITWPSVTTNKVAGKGKIVDMKPDLENDHDWYSSFNKSVWKYVSKDEKITGIPLMTTYAAMYVNTDVLSDVGVSIPQTYEQLKEIIPVLRSKNIVPIAFDMSDDGLLLYRCIASMLGGKLNASNVSSSGAPNEYYIRAADYIKELYNMGAFPKDLFAITKKQCDNLFLSKKAAFIVRYSEFSENIDESGLFETVSINPFPVFEDGLSLDKAILYGAGSDTIFVSSKNWENEKMREKILSVVKYFTSQRSAYYIAENLGSVPTIKIRKAATKAKNQVYQRNCDFINSANQIIDFSNYYIDSDVLRHICDRFPLFLEDKITIQEVWDYAYRYVSEN